MSVGNGSNPDSHTVLPLDKDITSSILTTISLPISIVKLNFKLVDLLTPCWILPWVQPSSSGRQVSTTTDTLTSSVSKSISTSMPLILLLIRPFNLSNARRFWWAVSMTSDSGSKMMSPPPRNHSLHTPNGLTNAACPVPLHSTYRGIDHSSQEVAFFKTTTGLAVATSMMAASQVDLITGFMNSIRFGHQGLHRQDLNPLMTMEFMGLFIQTMKTLRVHSCPTSLDHILAIWLPTFSNHSRELKVSNQLHRGEMYPQNQRCETFRTELIQSTRYSDTYLFNL